MVFKVVQTTPPRMENPYWEELMAKIGAHFIKKNCPTEQDLIDTVHDADAVISLFEPFTRRVMERLSKCKLISQIGVGYNPIDVDAATDHGILVSNTPDYCLEEMSDNAMALLLACARKIVRLNNAVKAGKWGLEARAMLAPMWKLRGQTLGLVGFGRIPRTLVRKAQAFGLRVLVYDPYLSPASVEGHYVELVEDLDRLLQESDFVSVHAALTAANRHMFGLEQFQKMKRTAYFINTARGGLVDEQALYTALTQGLIAGAGLDVMEQEPPPPDHPLFKLDNVVITPHTGQYSETAIAELMRRPAEEVVTVLQGGWPRGLVNPQVKGKFLQRWGKPG